MFKTKFKEFLPYMSEDTGLETGTGAEEPEVAEPDVEEGAEEPEVAEPAKGEADAAFAEMRRQLEAAERRAAEAEQMNQEYDAALGLFFQGDNKAAQARAYHDDLPLEQVIADMNEARESNNLRAQLEKTQNERDALLFENLKAQDKLELESAGYHVDKLEDLGNDYFAFRGMGISAVQAYEGLQMRKGTPPKSLGKVQTATPKKDYFTREEVEAMSPSEIKKNYDKIRNSMGKWK